MTSALMLINSKTYTQMAPHMPHRSEDKNPLETDNLFKQMYCDHFKGWHDY